MFCAAAEKISAQAAIDARAKAVYEPVRPKSLIVLQVKF
jgi:hypothetical protein